MNIQHSEIRIFGLITIALIVTLILYAGISTANAEGTLFGTKVIITGPIAAFISLLLVFRVIGLFNTSNEELIVSSVEPGKLNKRELENQLDILEVKVKSLRRRREEIQNIVKSLENNGSYVEAAFAGGMRRVSRPRI